MAESERNSFMMKYGRIEHVRDFINNMHKGGEHLDTWASRHALERIGNETNKKNGLTGNVTKSPEYMASVGKVLHAIHKHGSADQLSNFMHDHKGEINTEQLRTVWTEPHGGSMDGEVAPRIKHEVLGHPNVPPSILRDAMTHSDSFLRQSAVAHQNSPPDVVRMGLKDSSDHVEKEARRVARSRKIPLKATNG
jgi:hypothetical protein